MISGMKKFIKANSFPWTTLAKYWRNSSKSELIMDIFLPMLISALLLLLTSRYINDFKGLIGIFQQLSGQVIAAISILAGFNIASITIIATAGGISDALRNRRSTPTSLSVYEILIIFFTWAVIVQLIVVLLSVMLFYTGSFVPTEMNVLIPVWGWCAAWFWMSITLHSIFISIRNMKTLYLYVTYTPPPPTPPIP
ncbi:hypothetical protein [Paenibacillus sp. FSL H8-0259]|uniref:hypothetical protein n=1 Tax=Paenibacillus sp. FSL H8-0259 TaxID=1920423 RepID=UPI00096DD97B|nr:hypothetical protein [Paenibacillus sp. FSL H8-0259]OMF30941.1 hypothetical protein BK132_05795 [Paenibacillus sp. FSL H8-0259]